MNTLVKPPNLVTIIESRLSETERDAAVTALRARPDATIRDLAALLESKHAETVGSITLAELTRAEPPTSRQLAEFAFGLEFDGLVESGAVHRSGTTSGTRYWVGDP
jgi:hypothetical protein